MEGLTSCRFVDRTPHPERKIGNFIYDAKYCLFMLNHVDVQNVV